MKTTCGAARIKTQLIGDRPLARQGRSYDKLQTSVYTRYKRNGDIDPKRSKPHIDTSTQLPNTAHSRQWPPLNI
ncbi:hypothetical protein LZ554_009554 [Drepanopeziza brunnea f. sp. 'monogermtubi']|nr:hypothetical protein LZ554_009554 [Drepanopeziza brunnea f. sp. 'monogermtubi']